MCIVHESRWFSFSVVGETENSWVVRFRCVVLDGVVVRVTTVVIVVTADLFDDYVETVFVVGGILDQAGRIVPPPPSCTSLLRCRVRCSRRRDGSWCRARASPSRCTRRGTAWARRRDGSTVVRRGVRHCRGNSGDVTADTQRQVSKQGG